MADDPPTNQTSKTDSNSNSQPNENPISNTTIAAASTPFVAPLQIPPPLAPSFRPVMPPVPQFVPAQSHLSYQNPNLQPPVGYVPTQGQMMQQQQLYQQQNPPPGMRPFQPMPNGYPPPPHQQGGAMHIPGVRYPTPHPGMVRSAYPTYPLRPPGVLGMPHMLSRPPVPGVPGVRPMILPVIRPAVVPVTPAEKPQTTVWVGKIASTVDNEFMLSLLQLCGPVKSWKRTQNPTDGTPVSFGFCEFESPEGVLRALRLLSKFNIDGQELVLNVNQSTRDYLERYVQRRTENTKSLKEIQSEAVDEKDQTVNDSSGDKPTADDSKIDADSNKDEKESDEKDGVQTATFGIVTDDDKSVDQEALQKLTSMVEERLKNNPLPPPPVHLPGNGIRDSAEPLPTKTRDVDSEQDASRNDLGEGKNDDTGDSNTGEQDKPDTSSPDNNRRRDRGKDRDAQREKDREFDRLERETQRERERKERENERKLQEEEREYKERLRELEYREKEKEKLRQHEKEKERDKERKRKKEIKADESDDDDSRKRVRRSVLEDKIRKTLREKEDDIADRFKEQEEFVEAEKKAKEEQAQLKCSDALKVLSGQPLIKSENMRLLEESTDGGMGKAEKKTSGGNSLHENCKDDRTGQNSDNSESVALATDTVHNNNGPRKLGFGLVGSGKRTAVPSVFKEEDDDAHIDKKMKPLVPIDYSTEEIQAVQTSSSGQAPSNLVAAAEFAKRISSSNAKEDKTDSERERTRRSHDRSHRDRDHTNEEAHRTRSDKREKVSSREKNRESRLDKLKTADNKKLLDAKQLIDTIPKTKEELFSFDINWSVYDKHNLHERMRPWISKKIAEFLGEEEVTLVDYIVTSTQEHVKASQMLELLQSILDDEAEMFVLKMWRMLIFEIKKVETGLASKTKS